jgi:uncharacterized membrane protein
MTHLYLEWYNLAIVMPAVIRVAPLLCAAGGLYVCSYFTLVFYNLIAPGTKHVPRFCQLHAQTCQPVMWHPDAHLFGAPNFVLGFLYSIVVVIVALAELPEFARVSMMFISWGTVVLALYLVYSLYVKMNIICPLCLVSHALNLIIAILLTYERATNCLLLRRGIS